MKLDECMTAIIKFDVADQPQTADEFQTDDEGQGYFNTENKAYCNTRAASPSAMLLYHQV